MIVCSFKKEVKNYDILWVVVSSWYRLFLVDAHIYLNIHLYEHDSLLDHKVPFIIVCNSVYSTW